jgi:sorting nexin-8
VHILIVQDTTSVSESIESLKSQRDLYIAFRDLFVRYERLSADHVDLLRKKVEARQSKIEGLRAAQKPGFEAEVEKLINGMFNEQSSFEHHLTSTVIEQDNSTIGALLARRVFIRACMWHELAVVFHSRQAAQATLGWQAWIQGTVSSLNSAARVWDRMNEDVENMPLE